MGRVFQPKYAWTRSDGTRVERETKAWYVEYRNPAGQTVRRKAGVTKQQAEDVLKKIDSELLAEKNGLPIQRATHLSYETLLTQYLTSQRRKVSAGYLKSVEQQVRAIFTDCRIFHIGDLKPVQMEGFLNRLEDSGRTTGTANAYLESVKTMLSWAVRAQIIMYNPLAAVTKRPEIKRRRLRRALSDEEVQRLLSAALLGPTRRALRIWQNRPNSDGEFKPATIPSDQLATLEHDGQNNYLVYRIMLETGLRRNEVRSLAWSDVDLDLGTLTTRPWWSGNKNGKEETLPLAPGLWSELQTWHAKPENQKQEKVVKVTDRMLRTFNDDLVAAGIAKKIPLNKTGEIIPLGADGKPVSPPVKWKIEKRNAAGRNVDLHALRHTFGTRLGRLPGIDPKTVQTLMRHSDPRITFTIYVHPDSARLRNAVVTLGEIRTNPGHLPEKVNFRPDLETNRIAGSA